MKFALALLLVVAVSHGSAKKPVVSEELRAALEQGPVDVTIVFEATTQDVINSIQAQNFVTQNQKVTALYTALNAFTKASQKEVLDTLTKIRSTGIKPHYIVNTISTTAATKKMVESIEHLPGVAEIRRAIVVQLEKTLGSAAPGPHALEWGVNNIKAPAAWAQGVTGQGIVVSTIDTGVRQSHESLRDGYRADHGWFDPYTGSASPADSQGHGTHTMGTIAGKNGTGVAPDSTWIACLGCQASGCTEDALIQCGEWTLCPTNADGTDANCDLRPALSSNSWGGGNDDTFYNGVINAWNAAGILPIFAIGNAGPGCRSANSPGDQPGVISVGATDQQDQVASFSSHGPSLINSRIKPEVSAPGFQVRSAGHLTDVAYVAMSGTSMACPHVAGAAALLLSKTNGLTLAQVAEALEETAVRPTLGTVVCTGGGVDPDNPWPNNSFGHGKINAEAAVNSLSKA